MKPTGKAIRCHSCGWIEVTEGVMSDNVVVLAHFTCPACLAESNRKMKAERDALRKAWRQEDENEGLTWRHHEL